uniref:Holocytochrome c-type synthase n=1 Tax=Aplanochytrium stocchinoi TaxID=215587 RepID=A0A6S8EJ40_9STRA
MGSSQTKQRSAETCQPQKLSGCPVIHKKAEEEVTDPKNQMPAIPNQNLSKYQEGKLSTDRVQSTILKPSTSSEETWSYPSPQMFYNALMRKGKAGDVREEDMETVVAVHNNMNELAWREVLRWESLHSSETPVLSKFLGRPHDLTPKAWFKSKLLGHQKPFDRHDWTVDRNGTEVRYVIDFYYDEEKGKEDETPGLHDIHAVKSISIDARPAVDSFQSLLDRLRMPVMELVGSEPDISPLLFTPKNSSTNRHEDNAPAQAPNISECPVKQLGKSKPKQLPKTTFDNVNQEEMSSFSQTIQKNCAKSFARLNNCTSEEECQMASIGLTFCMANLVCSNEASRLEKDPSNEKALDDVTSCLNKFEKRALFLRSETKSKTET